MRLRDHPRSRGVYQEAEEKQLLSEGSSPLARGLRRVGGGPCWGFRIIPARAGFTTRSPSPRSGTRDHPRSRGVYSDILHGGLTGAGSSPLARGLPRRRSRGAPTQRIIPARAGFTGDLGAGGGGEWDHPRSRGVYDNVLNEATSASGSSPLARGLRSLRAGRQLPERIIPARAGFTDPARIASRCMADHPRSRGVYLFAGSHTHSPVGSSPLARGLRSRCRRASRRLRIIPARAGFTGLRTRSALCLWDHPRSRGVYR